MNATRNQIPPGKTLSPTFTLCESGLEARETFVDLAMQIQRQRLFILEFLQRRLETLGKAIRF